MQTITQLIPSINQMLLWAPPLLLALTFHEFCHGYVAWRLGDPTAANQGRLTMNPLRHLDPLGTLAFFLIRFGWAKPVPVNASYFRDPKRGMLLVALAGPMSNLLLAVLSAVAVKLFIPLAIGVHEQGGLANTVMLPLLMMLVNSVWINLLLCIFNLIPVPPLDGGRILAGFLPNHLAYSFQRYEQIGIVVILVLSLTGVLGKIISPVVRTANNLLLT
ncbi:MAG TPA: site-2 protease family protein [Desulfobulbaceae bacterium]|nr:site-2 protease family protein [Desulfobulbaceae bacterium]